MLTNSIICVKGLLQQKFAWSRISEIDGWCSCSNCVFEITPSLAGCKLW